jgi:alpha/beta superfamily hydrolase
MKMPEFAKPVFWGMIGGAAAATIVGFSWGGWITGGTADKMMAKSAQAAIVQAFTPLCVARAELQPEKIALLQKESSWQQDTFVIKAGWVSNVSEKYQSAVADVCASTVVEGLKAAATKPTG